MARPPIYTRQDLVNAMYQDNEAHIKQILQQYPEYLNPPEGKKQSFLEYAVTSMFRYKYFEGPKHVLRHNYVEKMPRLKAFLLHIPTLDTPEKRQVYGPGYLRALIQLGNLILTDYYLGNESLSDTSLDDALLCVEILIKKSAFIADDIDSLAKSPLTECFFWESMRSQKTSIRLIELWLKPFSKKTISDFLRNRYTIQFKHALYRPSHIFEYAYQIGINKPYIITTLLQRCDVKDIKEHLSVAIKDLELNEMFKNSGNSGASKNSEDSATSKNSEDFTTNKGSEDSAASKSFVDTSHTSEYVPYRSSNQYLNYRVKRKLTPWLKNYLTDPGRRLFVCFDFLSDRDSPLWKENYPSRQTPLRDGCRQEILNIVLEDLKTVKQPLKLANHFESITKLLNTEYQGKTLKKEDYRFLEKILDSAFQTLCAIPEENRTKGCLTYCIGSLLAWTCVAIDTRASSIDASKANSFQTKLHTYHMMLLNMYNGATRPSKSLNVTANHLSRETTILNVGEHAKWLSDRFSEAVEGKNSLSKSLSMTASYFSIQLTNHSIRKHGGWLIEMFCSEEQSSSLNGSSSSAPKEDGVPKGDPPSVQSYPQPTDQWTSSMSGARPQDPFYVPVPVVTDEGNMETNGTPPTGQVDSLTYAGRFTNAAFTGSPTTSPRRPITAPDTSPQPHRPSR